MVNERLDLTQKETWLNRSPEELASHFGYLPDINFKKALQEFIDKIVRERM